MNPMWYNVALQALLCALQAFLYAGNGHPAHMWGVGFHAGMAVMSLIVIGGDAR
jgi:hypothetical protein